MSKEGQGGKRAKFSLVKKLNRQKLLSYASKRIYIRFWAAIKSTQNFTDTTIQFASQAKQQQTPNTAEVFSSKP